MSRVISKRLRAVVASLFFLLASTAGVFAFNYPVVDKGVAAGVITTSASPTRADLFAAEELRIYLKKITGVDVPLIKGDIPAGKTAIIVGRHPDAIPVLADLMLFSSDQEAFATVSKDNRLYIVGNGESAVSFGVWDWLESLGVRWLFPTEKGEYVPHSATVSIAPIRKFSAPAMSYRGPCYSRDDGPGCPDTNAMEHGYTGSLMFSMRMRLNKYVGIFRSDIYGGVGSGHSYQYYLPTDKYFKDHPEWYNMVGGKRTDKWAETQVCFTNRDAAREFAKNLLVDVRNQVNLGIKIDRMQIYVSPNDWRTWCECPNCLKLADYDPDGNLTSSTSMVVNFANMVAEEVRKEFPTAKIVFYGAYESHVKPPTKVKPGLGICPEVVFAASANHAHPMFSDANSRFRSYFNQYAQMFEAIGNYEYYGHWIWFTPRPKITQMSYDIKEMVKYPNFYGMMSETHFHWGTQGPNLYLHPKLMWDPDLNVKAVMDDYYKAGFGPAAPYIKEYYNVLQKKMDSMKYVGDCLPEVSDFLTHEMIKKCDCLIDLAESKMVDMESNMRWRTNLIVQGWRYSAKTACAISLYRKPGKNKAADRRKALEYLNEVKAFSNTPDGLWVFENATLNFALYGLLPLLSTDLNNLAVGTHTYNEWPPYWGVLKFYADVSGFKHDIYSYTLGGYKLAPRTSGVVDIPFRAIDGHKITSLTLNTGWQLNDLKDPDMLKAKISVVKPDNTQVVIASDFKTATGDIVIPSSLLDQQVRVKMEYENTSTSNCPVMTKFNARITVE